MIFKMLYDAFGYDEGLWLTTPLWWSGSHKNYHLCAHRELVVSCFVGFCFFVFVFYLSIYCFGLFCFFQVCSKLVDLIQLCWPGSHMTFLQVFHMAQYEWYCHLSLISIACVYQPLLHPMSKIYSSIIIYIPAYSLLVSNRQSKWM